MEEPNLGQKLLAEFIGTFFLVFAGSGAIIIDRITGGKTGSVGIGLTFGLVVMVIVYAIGHISGAHINPAVTLGFTVGRHFPLNMLISYWIAQILGAILAAATLRFLFGNVAFLGATIPKGAVFQSFILEIFLTFLLMFVIAALTLDTRARGESAAIAIGGTIALESIFAGGISGASMNPARSFGPALVSGYLAHNWIYWLAPMIGASLAVLVYGLLKPKQV